MRRLSAIVFLSVCMALMAVPASAGQLFANGAAIPGFTGTTPFFDSTGPGDTLSGTVDYAVFAPGNFTYAGYTPTPGQLVYAYQVIMDPLDTHSLSNLTVLLNGDANNISAFELETGDIPPSGFNFSSFLPSATAGDAASWDFEVPGLGPNKMSYGLVFSSPNVPEYLFGSVVNGGLGALVAPLPTPSPVPIPEPSTAILLGLGMSAMAFVAAGRRYREARSKSAVWA